MNTKPLDLITMGRSSMDLYSNDMGTRFEDISSFAAYVGGSPTNIAVGAGPQRNGSDSPGVRHGLGYYGVARL